MSWLENVGRYVRATLDTRATAREFERLGISDDILAARAVEIDEATPAFAQTRGQSWADIGPASSAFLALIRRLPNGAGADALITEFRDAARRGHV